MIAVNDGPIADGRKHVQADAALPAGSLACGLEIGDNECRSSLDMADRCAQENVYL